MKDTGSDHIIVRGKVTEGIKEAAYFTQLSWANEQFIARLGIDPYPGTLNLEVVADNDLEKLEVLKTREGIEIVPGEPGYCNAKCFHILIGDKVKIRGALVIPQVPGYEKTKLEIISKERIRDVLSLLPGDVVSVEIILDYDSLSCEL